VHHPRLQLVQIDELELVQRSERQAAPWWLLLWPAMPLCHRVSVSLQAFLQL
jgi:hypothetical protein